MVEGDDRRDLVREQLVHEPVVEVEAGLVHLPAPLGQDPRPRDGEAEGAGAELAQEGDVLWVAMVEVARNFAGLAVADVALDRAEAVPDARAPSVLVDCTLDLVRGCRHAPTEGTREAAVAHRALSWNY